MSDALRHSIHDLQRMLDNIAHSVDSSGLDFAFEQEQLSFQLEGLMFEFQESVDKAIRLADLDD